MRHDDPRLDRLGLPLLLGLTTAAYAGVLGAGFVFDDVALVVDNPRMGSLDQLGAWFGGDLWATGQAPSGYYRPVFAAALSLGVAIFGKSAAALHLHGLVWHLAAVAMLHRLLRAHSSAAGALAGAALFALHPVQSEAVAWIASHNDPMAAALALGALLLAREDRTSRLAAAAALMALAALCKESVLLVPALVPILGPAPWGRRGAALGLGVAIALAFRGAAGVGGAAWPTPEQWALLSARAPTVAGLYGSLLVWPWPLSCARVLTWLHVEAWRVGLGLAALAGVLVLALRRRDRLSLAGLTLAALALAPVVLPIAAKDQLGERYLYLPMAGMAMVLAALPGRAALLALAAATPAALLALSLRLPDWASERALWESAVAATPSAWSHEGLAMTLDHEGDLAGAATHYAAAIADPPAPYDSCHGLLEAILRLGDPAEAARAGDWASGQGCDQNPRFVGAWAVSLAFTGAWDRAEAALNAHPTPDPRGRDLVVRGAIARRAGDEAAWQAVLSRWPGPEPLEPQVTGLLSRSAR